jgi:hypothetical protein
MCFSFSCISLVHLVYKCLVESIEYEIFWVAGTLDEIMEHDF